MHPSSPLLSNPFFTHIVSSSYLGTALWDNGWSLSLGKLRRGMLVRQTTITTPAGLQGRCLTEVPEWIPVARCLDVWQWHL